ncbi:MAG: DUF4956 domain-containing protein [Mogibacterium sp.]|nr:DUF4956 domain-containing protein [Mogibacterium sp.]
MNYLLTSVMANGLTGAAFAAATVCSILAGLYIGFIYSRQKRFSQSFLLTVALLPITVQLVIMLVNGNIGAGVAVAGAFSLVRFRSAPGSGQEITAIFLSMAVGLATGMGYLGIAVIFTLVFTLLYLLLSQMQFGAAAGEERILKISIPESLDYEELFDDVLDRYTAHAELIDVRTASLGSLYKLTYRILPRKDISIKQMIDELRVRNGNLEIACGRPVSGAGEL